MHKKQSQKFCGSKEDKNSETHPIQPEKGETGCVLGAGGDESGKNRLRTDARGRHRMQHKPGKLDRIQTSLSTKNPQTMRFSQDLGTRVLAGAEGLGLGCRLGRFAAERHWRSLTPRHALRGAQPCLVAKTFRPVTKNSATAKAVALFLAGAEGLEPSARGFGVDVGKCSKEQGRAGVARFLPQVRKGAVLVWCCGEILRSQ